MLGRVEAFEVVDGMSDGLAEDREAVVLSAGAHDASSVQGSFMRFDPHPGLFALVPREWQVVASENAGLLTGGYLAAAPARVGPVDQSTFQAAAMRTQQ